mgnify:CR=1
NQNRGYVVSFWHQEFSTFFIREVKGKTSFENRGALGMIQGDIEPKTQEASYVLDPQAAVKQRPVRNFQTIWQARLINNKTMIL